MIQFHQELSENSVRQRYFEFLTLDERVAHDRMIRICFTDYDREWAIVAEIGQEKNKKIIGIGRLSRIPGTFFAGIKMTIVDAFHNQGLGSQLLEHLLKIAKQEKIKRVDAYILSENHGMIKICEKQGFYLLPDQDPFITHAQRQVD